MATLDVRSGRDAGSGADEVYLAPAGLAPVIVAETHSARVFLVGDRAYKVKKPVSLGFLDFSTRALREVACHREVEVNRRLAPDVYLGVADVTTPDGTVRDHAVVMRRMPDELRLSRLVAEGADVGRALRDVARLVATFHSLAPRSVTIDAAATADAVAALWRTSLDACVPFAGRLLPREQLAEVRRLALRYIDGRRPLFDHRIARGRSCDGHGDLLADDIFCLRDAPRVLDALDFDDRLRWGDALLDVAFLAMDLERLGRPDLADVFVRAYREFTADDWPDSLADHYIAYRALIRAKVACVRWEQGDTEAAATARQLLALAARHLRSGRVRVVLVGGLPGVGKTTLANAVAQRLGAVLLRSDEVRKELRGVAHHDRLTAPPGEGAYLAAATGATYAALLARARLAVVRGETVILDASWQDPAQRQAAAQLADTLHADLVEIRATAPVGIAARRLVARALEGSDASDATPEVLDHMAETAEPWPSATSIDTASPIEAGVADALRVIDRISPW